MNREDKNNRSNKLLFLQGTTVKSLNIQLFKKRKSRTIDEIKAEILQCALRGSLKTRIMYECRLSYEGLCKHLSNLTEKGFLEKKKIELRKTRREMKIEEHDFFLTTEKGRKWLNLYRQLKKIT